MSYENMDPQTYRDDLIAMGATEEDADAAVRDLERRR